MVDTVNQYSTHDRSQNRELSFKDTRIEKDFNFPIVPLSPLRKQPLYGITVRTIVFCRKQFSSNVRKVKFQSDILSKCKQILRPTVIILTMQVCT